jgi:hypothetical protein
MNRTQPAETPSPAISRKLAQARVIVAVLTPNWPAISGTVNPRFGRPLQRDRNRDNRESRIFCRRYEFVEPRT